MGAEIAQGACFPLPMNESSARMGNGGDGFTEIDGEVAAVLAFVISHMTFLAAQDDETGRCPKAVYQSLRIPIPVR